MSATFEADLTTLLKPFGNENAPHRCNDHADVIMNNIQSYLKHGGGLINAMLFIRLATKAKCMLGKPQGSG